MQIIAHRGANKEALENSWSAFYKAIEIGVDRIELDVQITKDYDLVIVHDEDLSRTTGVNGIVSELTREQLSKIRLLNGEPIPFLDEVLDKLLDKVEINIEIKSKTAVGGELTRNIIKNHNKDINRIIISSFYLQPLQDISMLDEGFRIACLWGDLISWPELGTFAPNVFMNQVRAKILHPWTNYVSKHLMELAQIKGWTVYPYVSMKGEGQDPKRLWRQMKEYGVSGLCTNYPREFKQWVEHECCTASK